MVTRGTADRGAPPPVSSTSSGGSLSADGARLVSRERAGRFTGRHVIFPFALAALVLALVVVAAATGSTAVVIAVGVLLGVIAVFLLIYGTAARRATAADVAAQPDPESRQAARAEPMPGAFMNADPDVPVGDTVHAHDEINPHDLPPGHPGREAAERQAGGPAGTTRGDDELNEAAPPRRRPGEPGRSSGD